MPTLQEPRLPRVFIGSSVEGLNVANALQENLDFDAEVTVWSQGIFVPNAATLMSLIEASGNIDFATFVFSADDVVQMRSDVRDVVRDNVIFEYGLFCGAIGVERCSFIVPRDDPHLHLPTDLLGIIGLDYNAARSDQKLVAALGSAANKLRRLFRERGLRSQSEQDIGEASNKLSQAAVLERCRSLWSSNDLLSARAEVRSIPSDPRDPEFQERMGSVQKVFAFLESLADAILNYEVNEVDARTEFERPIVSFWSFAATTLLPVGQVDPDDWWDPLPNMAVLSLRWRREEM